jgi:hypothetical protein
MDEGRDENSSGGGGPPHGNSKVVGNDDVGGSGSATSACVAATSPPAQTVSTILRNLKGHRGGRYSGGPGNKHFPPSRRQRLSSQRVISPNNELPGSSGGSHGRDPVNQPTGDRQSLPSSQRQPRHRIRKDKGKWKPYHMLSWEEKKERDALETQRAEEKRTQLTHLGYPQAPYNTTQFLMADHGCETGNSDGLDVPSSDESSTAEEDWASMDRGYDQEWARVLREHLSTLSKNELIVQVLETEQEKSKLEQRVRALEKEVRDLTPGGDGKSADQGMLVD